MLGSGCSSLVENRGQLRSCEVEKLHMCSMHTATCFERPLGGGVIGGLIALCGWLERGLTSVNGFIRAPMEGIVVLIVIDAKFPNMYCAVLE